MLLHDVNEGIQKRKKGRRIGRGVGSGRGKTSGRGHKGQRARAGFKQLPIFQGGGSPLVRRVPKRGFTNSWALTVATINVSELADLFTPGEKITPEILHDKGILKRRFDLLKILGNGELTVKLDVSAHQFSASAKEKIEQAGGTATVLAGRANVEEYKAGIKAEKKKAGPKKAKK
jgi:large subunit ribosomal protein L15